MEEGGEQPLCPVCIEFEPQAWRKSLCRNCFKTFEQHAEDASDTEPAAAAESSKSGSSASPKDKDAKESGGKSATKESIQKSADKPSSPLSSSTSSSPTSSSSALASSPSTAASASLSSSSKSSTAVTSTTQSGSKSSYSKSSLSSPSSSTSTTTTTTSSGKSFLVSSKAKDVASKFFEDKASKMSAVSKSGSSSSTSSTSTSSKTSTEKKVSLVSALAGKIETGPKRGSATAAADSKLTSSTTDSKAASTTSSSTTTTTTDSKSKTALGSEKKALSLSSTKTAGGGTKEKVTSPSSALSLFPYDTSARAKWEKRVSGTGGGGGTGAKSDVTKGQKGGEVKGTAKTGADAAQNGSGSAAKGRVGELGTGKKAGKEADTAEAPSTTKKAPWEKTSLSSSSSSPSTSATSDKSPTASSKSKFVDTSGKASPKFSLSGKSPTPPSSPSSPTKKDASPSSSTAPSKTPTTTKTDSKKDTALGLKQEAETPLKESPASSKSPDAASLTASELLLKEREKAVKELEQKTRALEKELAEKDESLRKMLASKDEELSALKEAKEKQEKQVGELRKCLEAMEAESKEAKKEAEKARKASMQGQREEWEKTLSELRTQVAAMEEQCCRLESDNQSLLCKLREQEQAASQVADKRHVQDDNRSEVTGLQGELKTSELEVEDLREENMELREQLGDLRREMDEMYDTFRENELDEFRELQRELDLTAKNCRVLQFKLRKAERRADQVDSDRQHYEEKLRSLQSQFESGDARSHIEALEEELRTAKEVSVRLHDELDLMEDRRNKAMEENRHLSDLLEQTDKKQFRMEMEIDKLRDQIADLKQQLRERSPTRKEGTPDRRDVLGRQGSQEYDCAQLMRDLCDSVERETDIKEQLKFIEEESRMLRKKLAEMEDENEALRVQLKKLSLKASRWKEESEGRHAQGKTPGDEALSQERERLDSSDDETSVVTLKLQMALLEQELMTSQRGQAEVEKEAESLKAEVASLQQKLKELKQEEATRRDRQVPLAPDAYYEEKIRELTSVADELRWRIIEKDREIERLSTASIAHARHHGHHGHGSRGDPKRGSLKKSKSLDSDPVVEDLRRQLEFSQHEVASLRHQLSAAREQREASDNEATMLRQQLQVKEQLLAKEQQQQQQRQQQQQPPVPCIQADDAAVENIELRDALKRGEEEVRVLREQVRTLTDKLHALSRASSPRLLSSASTSPLSPTPPAAAVLSPTGSSPLSSAAAAATTTTTTATTTTMTTTPTTSPPPSAAHAEVADAAAVTAAASTQPPGSSIPHMPTVAGTRDLHEQLRESEQDRRALAAKMAELEGDNSRLQALVKAGPGAPGGRGPEGLGAEGGAGAGSGKTVTGGSRVERRVVTVGEDESREVLMDKILDMEEEINDLLLVVKRHEEENENKARELTALRKELQDAQDVGRQTELQLLRELDMLHDKNSVLSNLLDIIHERADNAEQELEKYMQDNSAPSTRSASAVSQVSALSDTSCGSDEVFLSPPAPGTAEKGQIIHRDWEAKLKNRIESLERLLAEERQKVNMAEKKLHFSAEQGLAPSLSDDVKLRLREKELLQEELWENQRHLRVATDQIQGMRERLHALEEEHHRLKEDYGKLCNELDRRELDSDQTDQDSDKTPENSVEPEGSLVALRAARLNTAATPSTTTDKDSSTKTDPQSDVTTEGVAASSDDVTALQHEVARYKLKAEQLEYKVEEISDIWRSKSAATEREKQALEAQLREKTHEISQMNETLEQLQQQLKTQSAALSQAEQKAGELSGEVSRRQAAELELHELLTQSTEREHSFKQLRDAVGTRDERLKEKDDIIHYLNSLLEQRQIEIQQLQQRVTDLTSRLATQTVTSSQDLSPSKEAGGETDVEKENARLREKTQSLRVELEEGDATRKDLEKSRRMLEEESLSREQERAELQAALNIAEEKLRLYEAFSTTSSDKVVENVKKESLKYFAEKEALAAQVTSLQHELATCQKSALETTARLKQEVNSKLYQLKDAMEANKRLQPELDRLRAQAERAYRIQQEERLLRAEHQAMKVRYETRLEKVSQEYSKMVRAMEGLQKERAGDRELVAGVQKAMTLIREAHSQDQMRWEEEKTRLDRQIQELTEAREVVSQMQQKTTELREALASQERSRADALNKFATDRAAWEIDRASLQSKINQLEEQVNRTKKDTGSSVALETAWAKERAQQQRLLSEAHGLALDLQKQLTSRNQQAEQNQRHLADQLEAGKKAWDRDRKDMQKQIAELESRVKWQGSLQRRVLEVQDRAEREIQQARKERAEMTRRLVETRQQQARDARALDDVMAGLVRLRELGTTLASEEDKPHETTGQTDLDRDLLKYIKEATVQIATAANELTKRGTNGSGHIRRSLSSSELELLREELNELRQEGGDVFPALDVTVAVTQSGGPSTRGAQPLRSFSLDSSQGSDVTLPSILRPLSASRASPLSKTPSYASGTRSAQGSRATSPDMYHVTPDLSPSRRFLESSPSAVSGSGYQRRASEERKSPSSDRLNASKETSPSLRDASPKLQDVSPKLDAASSDEKQRRFSSGRSASASAATTMGASSATTLTTTTTTTSSSDASTKLSRPRTLTKSLSVDSQPTWMPTHPAPRSYSASTTPTQPGPALLQTSDSEGVYSSSSLTKRRIGGLSPRSARKKFFEEQPAEKVGFLSWPKRGKQGGGTQRQQQQQQQQQHPQGVDPGEMRRGAEEEHEWLLSRVLEVPPHPPTAMKTSASWDEKMHHRVVTTPTAEASPAPGGWTGKAAKGGGDSLPSKLSSTDAGGAASQGTQPTSKGGQASSAKDRRRLFKKSSSLDSDVGTCIARAGMTTLLPPAVPSTFSPSDFLATLKGKLAPAFSRKSKEEDRPPQPRPPSPLFIPTTVPDIPLRPSTATTTSTTTIPAGGSTTTGRRSGEGGSQDAATAESLLEDTRGRGFSRRQDLHRESRSDVRDVRWRSMSADRVTNPLLVHTDVIVPAQVWQFSETAV